MNIKTDASREARISDLHRQLSTATPEKRRLIWSYFRAEIMVRSPTQIAKMERERGLCGPH